MKLTKEELSDISTSLQALQELFSVPGTWTTRFLARNKFGENVNPRSSNAVCWCFFGGIQKVSNLSLFSEPKNLINFIENILPNPHNIILWNDAPERKQQDILNLIAEIQTKVRNLQNAL